MFSSPSHKSWETLMNSSREKMSAIKTVFFFYLGIKTTASTKLNFITKSTYFSINTGNKWCIRLIISLPTKLWLSRWVWSKARITFHVFIHGSIIFFSTCYHVMILTSCNKMKQTGNDLQIISEWKLRNWYYEFYMLLFNNRRLKNNSNRECLNGAVWLP